MIKPSNFASLEPPSWGGTPSAILRPGQSAYARSPYAAEASPWVSREEWETLLILRGAIMASFAQVETMLAELSIRLSRDQSCADLRSTYPHALGKRLSYLRACFAIAPYRRREGLATEVFRRFEAGADLRHIMAHGAVSGPSFSWLVTFRDFRPGPNGEIAVRDHRYTYADLEGFAYGAARLARRVQQLAGYVTGSDWLPAMSADV